MKDKSIVYIYEQLIFNYRYYDDVFYTFIIEAIENTKKDFENKVEYSLEEIHNNIINNYI